MEVSRQLLALFDHIYKSICYQVDSEIDHIKSSETGFSLIKDHETSIIEIRKHITSAEGIEALRRLLQIVGECACTSVFSALDSSVRGADGQDYYLDLSDTETCESLRPTSGGYYDNWTAYYFRAEEGNEDYPTIEQIWDEM